MTDSIAEIETLTHNTQTASSKDLKSELQIVRVIIIVQAIGILFMIWLTARLGINPVLKAVDRIKEDSPLPVIGANEFHYLARTYNKMYDVYKRSVEHLNYKASHDELTQLYNRAGYDLLVTSIELSTTIMLVIDVDNFKQVNDEFGHEMGDKVLKRVARTIKGSFRSDDYVCRVGGDEFVVLMVHADESQRDLIAAKIDYINSQLMVPSAGLPAATVSAGVAFGSRTNDPNELFNRADSALYETKHRGRHGITFYEEEAVPTFSENV